jgi:hypothetical protein
MVNKKKKSETLCDVAKLKTRFPAVVVEVPSVCSSVSLKFAGCCFSQYKGCRSHECALPVAMLQP